MPACAERAPPLTGDEIEEKLSKLLEKLDPDWQELADALHLSMPYERQCPTCQSKHVISQCKGPYSTLRCNNGHLFWPWSSKLVRNNFDGVDCKREEPDPVFQNATCSQRLYYGPENWLKIQKARVDALLRALPQIEASLRTLTQP